jgi:hypothetical protein
LHHIIIIIKLPLIFLCQYLKDTGFYFHHEIQNRHIGIIPEKGGFSSVMSPVVEPNKVLSRIFLHSVYHFFMFALPCYKNGWITSSTALDASANQEWQCSKVGEQFLAS